MARTKRSRTLFLVLGSIASALATATVFAAMPGGGRNTPMTNPTVTEAGITPNASVYGASLGFGKRWDNLRVSASIPYYVLDAGGARETESGFGDLLVVGEWDIVPEQPGRYALLGSLLWKLPTADEAEGLGTGETDYGAVVELGYRFERYKPFASVGYVWKGDAPTVKYRDGWLYSLGITRYAGADEFYVSYDARERTLPGFDDTRLLSVGWLHGLTARQTLQFDVSAGLNGSSPDVLVYIELMTWF